MKKKRVSNIVKKILVVLLVLVCILEGVMIKVCIFNQSSGIASTAKLKTIKTVIDRYYLDKVDDQKLEDYAYKGMIAGLGDPYATYYTKKELAEVMEADEGVYSGVGALLQKDEKTGYIRIVRVFKGSPAEEAGVRKQDLIYKINGKEISADEDLTNLVSKIKGKEGTTVKVTFLRDGKERSVILTRRKVETPTVESQMLRDSIGYVQITEFDDITVTQFDKAVSKLEKQGMKSLIIDLRDNPGGLVTSVTSIADRILGKGVVVSIKSKNGKEMEYKAKTKECVDVPIAVLINGNSASASEILAGAIQDYKVGTIVGTTSFGKGIVQDTIQLSDGSAVKLTIANYYTPKGRNIHKKGITPDVKVKLSKKLENKSEIKKSEDNQLQKAMEVVSK